MRYAIPCLMCLLQASSIAFAGEPEAPNVQNPIQVLRTTDIITIDGNLSEQMWQRPGVTSFYQKEPDQGKPAIERTELWFAYDNEAVYVAARMHDSAPDSIISRLVRRDGDVKTDDIAVFFDPYHDQRRSGVYFGLSAAGTQYEAVLYNDDWSDNSWDGVWEGKVQIDDRGWTAEMRIPYSQLRFQGKEQHVWGVNFIRRNFPVHNSIRGLWRYLSRFFVNWVLLLIRLKICNSPLI